jgi:glycolate oxidase
MDRLSLRASCEYLNEHLPCKQAGATLLIELDGSDQEVVERDAETVGELCLRTGAQEVYVADNATTRDRLWNVRKNVPEALGAMTHHQGREDIVVPPKDIPEAVAAAEGVGKRFGLITACFGHAGDGNIHIWLLKRPEDTVQRWRQRLARALAELYRETKALGGTLTGEHGIGCKRKKFIGLFLGKAELDLMRRIKRALDPRNIMNPGKVFDV